jgi:hypothetical protein
MSLAAALAVIGWSGTETETGIGIVMQPLLQEGQQEGHCVTPWVVGWVFRA